MVEASMLPVLRGGQAALGSKLQSDYRSGPKARSNLQIGTNGSGTFLHQLQTKVKVPVDFFWVEPGSVIFHDCFA